MKDLIQYIVKALVDTPERVVINEISGRQCTVFEIVVAKVDLGKVIGKKGKNISALRTIVSAAAAKYRTRVVVELLE